MKRLAIAVTLSLLVAGGAQAEPIGNSTCNAGVGTLSQDIYTAYLADTSRNGFVSSMTSTQQAMICSQVWAFVQFMTNLPTSGPQNFGNGMSGVTSTATVATLSGDATPLFLNLFNHLGTSSYNPMVQAGDEGLIFGVNTGASDTQSFFLGPWSSHGYGLRYRAGGYWGFNISPSGSFPMEFPDAALGDVHFKIGQTYPLFLRSNIPTIGFNDYWNGSASVYGSLNYAGEIHLDTSGNLGFQVTAATGAAGATAALVTAENIDKNANVTLPTAPYAQAQLTSSYALPGAGWSALPLTTQYDTATAITGSGTTSFAFTVPANRGGKYYVAASADLDPATTSGDFLVSIYVNGVETFRLQRAQVVSTDFYCFGASGTINLNAGDVVKPYVYNNPTPNTLAATYTHFSIYKLPF